MINVPVDALTPVPVPALAAAALTRAMTAAIVAKVVAFTASKKAASSSAKPKPTWKRMKYIPGPIGSLRDQAAAVGLDLTIDAEDNLVLERKHGLQGWERGLGLRKSKPI